MSVKPWARRYSSKHVRTHRNQRRLVLEQLENRLVPATGASIGSPTGPFLEGVALNFTSTVTDGVTPVYAWSVTKDGLAFATGTPTDTDTFSFIPDDNATYVVSLSLTDPGDAGQTLPLLADSGSIIVTNQPPVAAVSGPTTGNMGQTLTFSLSATDPSTVDTTFGFSYTVHWNDGSPDTAVPVTVGSATVTHAFSLPGNHTFTVTATDKDGGVSAPASHTVSISGVAVINGVLTAVGTDGNDAIFFVPKGKPTASNANVRVLFNGQNMVFSGVNSISVDAKGGNDFVHLAGSIRVNAIVLGGAGDDRIKGAKGSDILVGGDGNDWINGGQGADINIGGQGSDRLIGGPGDDLLVANATTFDADVTSLQALQTAWLSSSKLADRVAAVTNTTAAVFLSSTGTTPTLTEDNATDRVTGTAGKDAFFATLSDVVTDMHQFEFLNGVKGTPHGHGHGH